MVWYYLWKAPLMLVVYCYKTPLGGSLILIDARGALHLIETSRQSIAWLLLGHSCGLLQGLAWRGSSWQVGDIWKWSENSPVGGRSMDLWPRILLVPQYGADSKELRCWYIIFGTPLEHILLSQGSINGYSSTRIAFPIMRRDKIDAATTRASKCAPTRLSLLALRC